MIDIAGRKLDELKADRVFLVQTLTDAGAVVKGNTVRCPFCEDHRPSAGIYSANGSGFRYKCQSCGFGGSIVDVVAKIEGVEPAAVLRRLSGGRVTVQDRPGQSQVAKPISGQGKGEGRVFPTLAAVQGVLPGTVAGQWTYLDTTGEQTRLIVFRLSTPEGKTYRQVTPVDGGYILKGPERPLPLYGLPGLAGADTVVVCEGEKCCDSIRPYGFTGTTSPMGAGKAGLADWTPIKGKIVYVWPDNDGPGHKHADDVAGILFGLGCTVYRVDPAAADLSEKEDAADFVAQCKVLEYTEDQTRAAIQAVLDKSRPIRPSGGLMAGLNAIIDGTAEPAPLPQFRTLAYLSRPLIPKTVTLVCGRPGAGKSFFLMQTLLGWVDAGFPFAAIELEDDKAYHLHRALAQLEGQAVYFDRDFIKANPEQVRGAYARHADTLDRLAVKLWDMPKAMMSYANLLDWSRDRLKDGARVLAIDPITIIQPTENPWIADPEFMDGFKRLLIEHDAAGLIVTHPKKGITKPCLDDLSGGAAWQRFSHAIIWIDESGGKMRIKTACGEIDTTVNRTLQILKARNGKGHGMKLGYIFRELLFAEQGVIVGRAKNEDDE
jgi:hypothetical protein